MTKRVLVAVIALLLLAAPAVAQQDFDDLPTADSRAGGMRFVVLTEDGNYVTVSLEALLSGVVVFPGPALDYWGRFAEDDATMTDAYMMAGQEETSITTAPRATVVLPRVTFTGSFGRVGLLFPSAWLPLAEGYPRQQFGLPGPAWTVARTTTIGGTEYTLLTDSVSGLISDATSDESRTFIIRP